MMYKDVAHRIPSLRTRRGSISVFAVVALMVFLAVVALVADSARLRENQIEMQTASDAAARAAVQVFVDDRTLLNTVPPMVTLSQNARAAAILYGQSNLVANTPLVIEDNEFNLDTGDLLIGTLDTPTSTTFVLADLPTGNNTDLRLINAVRIVARRTRDRGNAQKITVGRLFNLPEVDMVQTSTAMLDRDVIGFRPVGTSNLPLAPLRLLSDPTGVNPSSFEFATQFGLGTDLYTFDKTTKTFSLGTDGLTEFIAELGGGLNNVSLVSIGAATVTAASTQITAGVTANDVAGFGGQLQLATANNRLELTPIATPAVGSGDMTTLRASLEALRLTGELRIWPISFETNGANPLIRGFVAARVVTVDPEPVNPGDPQRFRLQAGSLSTAAALTDSNQRGVGGVNIVNPYIAKVRLLK